MKTVFVTSIQTAIISIYPGCTAWCVCQFWIKFVKTCLEDVAEYYVLYGQLLVEFKI